MRGCLRASPYFFVTTNTEVEMKRIKVSFITLVSALLVIHTGFTQEPAIKDKHPCMTCEDLTNIILPDVTISSADRVYEDNSHCRVVGITGCEIQFELLLPENWNARFVTGGGGGFVGYLAN
jgi:hypothetical protein